MNGNWLRNYDKRVDGILIFIVISMILSILMRQNILIGVSEVIIASLIGIYIYSNEKRLFYFTLLGVCFSSYLSQYISVMSYFLYGCIILMIIKLLEKIFVVRKRIIVDKVVVLLSSLVLILNIFSLIYNGYYINPSLAIFYVIKKFSFVILYLFILNLEISKEEVSASFKFIILCFLMQIPIILYQFFIGTSADDITGLFGLKSTGILLQYLCYVLCFIVITEPKYIKIPYFDLIFSLIILVYCALAEVKFGFILIPAIYILNLFLKKRYIKIMISVVVLSIIMGSIYGLLIEIYPESNFLSSEEKAITYLDNAYGSDSVNRSGFMPILDERVFNTNYKKIFGTGLATITPSNNSTFAGPLYNDYSEMNLHYFAIPYSIVENGIVGSLLMISIYIYFLFKNIILYIKSNDNNSTLAIISLIITFSFVYYNCSIIGSHLIIVLCWYIISCTEKKLIE